MSDEQKKSCLTTLCYIEKGDSYLMMHRVKKENDVNKDKWVGVGGHFEEGESPEECLLREVREETGLRLLSWQFRGIVTFISDNWPTEYMCLYTADAYERAGSEEIACVRGAVRGAAGEIAACEKEPAEGDWEVKSVGNPENWECSEGTLEWVRKEDVYDLPVWEGDKLFFRLLEETDRFFSLKLRYEGERLAEVLLDGRPVDM